MVGILAVDGSRNRADDGESDWRICHWVFFARYKKMPVIIFNIPGFVPLVPGAIAYQAVRAVVMGQLNAALRYVSRVIMIAGAIAVGFMLAQLLSELLYRRAVLKPKK